MKRLSDYFYLSKRDRVVTLWILAIVSCISFFFYFSDKPSEIKTVEDQRTDWQKDSFQTNSYSKNYNYSSEGYRGNGGERTLNLHPFDLNTATAEELKSLGFSKWQIASVMKYRSMGGIYRRPEQMTRIAGMTKGQYDALLPYFTVGDDFKPASEFVEMPERNGGEKYSHNSEKEGKNSDSQGDSLQKAYKNYPVKLLPGEKIDLNSADTTALMKIPGIGSTRAAQIVKYRSLLGGFYSIAQLSDLRNVPAEVQQYLVLVNPKQQKIRINRLTISQMTRHPYISFFQAQTIWDYRQQKGRIESIEELQDTKNFTPEKINRLKPYLDYE